jgi:5-methylcytosine-specific restriction endonuclease McrA
MPRFAKVDHQRTYEAYASGEFTDKKRKSFWAQDGTVRLSGTDWHRRKKECLERDKFTCRKCGKWRGDGYMDKLDAHHVIERGKGGSDDLSNLESRCKRFISDCHTSEHPQVRWGPEVKAQ